MYMCIHYDVVIIMPYSVASEYVDAVQSARRVKLYHSPFKHLHKLCACASALRQPVGGERQHLYVLKRSFDTVFKLNLH